MCKIAECDGKPVAKGLCARHYMRARRTGDPTETRKPGPHPSAVVAAHRALFPEASPRTQARLAKLLLNNEERTTAMTKRRDSLINKDKKNPGWLADRYLHLHGKYMAMARRLERAEKNRKK